MEWRISPSFPDYEVSDQGDVRRRINSRGRGGRQAGFLIQGSIRYGYRIYRLASGNGVKYARANRLVCEAWHGPAPSSLHEAAHWDGDKLGNRPANLRWATRLENAHDKERHGRVPKGQKVHTCRLTPEQVLTIREKARLGISHRKIAAEFSIARNTAWAIISCQSWKHL